MNIISLNKLEVKKRPGGLIANKIPSNFKSQSVNLIFEPGMELPLHTTPVDVIFYVIKGEGTLTIGDENKIVKEGDFIDSPANIPHGWKNSSDNTLSILVIKLYS